MKTAVGETTGSLGHSVAGLRAFATCRAHLHTLGAVLLAEWRADRRAGRTAGLHNKLQFTQKAGVYM